MGQYDRQSHEETEEQKKEFYIRQTEFNNKLNEDMKIYTDYICGIKNNEFIPVKHAIGKYRRQLNKPLKNTDPYSNDGKYIGVAHKANDGTTDKYILGQIMNVSKILMIEKQKNKWVCSKDRLEIFEFDKFNLCRLGGNTN